jgi:hypothetical protein
MEQGKLSVTKTKKGKIEVAVLFKGKKGQTKLTIHDSNIADTALTGKDVEFEREEGQVSKVICQGETIYSKSPVSHSVKKYIQAKEPSRGSDSPTAVTSDSCELEMKHVINIQDKARAPYNFIPLNEKVVESEPIPDFDRYHPDRYTGWIDLEIKTKTPLYIRDTLNKDEMKKQAQEEPKKTEKAFINSDFFSPGGKPKIPGSSIRGMIRTLVEIMSYGRFGAFGDKYLYFRGLADTSNLRLEYQSKMSSKDKQTRKSIYKMSAGFLFKRGFDYFIRPAPGFKQIPKKEAKMKVEKSGQSYNVFNFYQVDDGWIVVSGPMQKKKKEWFIYSATSDDNFLLPEVDTRNYKNDTNRSLEVPNLLVKAGKMKEVPCFYVRWKDSTGKDRVSFGHTGMFRLAYEKSIGDHIPENLKRMSDGKYDIPEAIFGNAETFAGRVFFEDAVLKDGQRDVLMDEDIPKLLQSPKPTTFQHYLVQTSDNIKARRHYNDNSAIRGNKFYWHKAGNDWIERDDKKRANENLITRIKPVKPETVFIGRIRFENLSKVELGALLFSISLPKGCYHKLGLGKPIGLGSVEITPFLLLSHRKKRYEDVFFEWENEPDKSDKIPEFKRVFADYVLKQIGEKNKNNLWDLDRMQELATMLNFEIGKGLDDKKEIRYMEIEGPKDNEFKNRPILPFPSRVT